MLFYKQPKYHKSTKFDFFLEIVYEDLSQKDLQDILNQKIIDENGEFRTCLTVYEKKPKRRNDPDQLDVLCHILVFEKRKTEETEGNDTIYMVVEGNEDLEMDPIGKINEFLY